MSESKHDHRRRLTCRPFFYAMAIMLALYLFAMGPISRFDQSGGLSPGARRALEVAYLPIAVLRDESAMAKRAIDIYIQLWEPRR